MSSAIGSLTICIKHCRRAYLPADGADCQEKSPADTLCVPLRSSVHFPGGLVEAADDAGEGRKLIASRDDVGRAERVVEGTGEDGLGRRRNGGERLVEALGLKGCDGLTVGYALSFTEKSQCP